MGFFKDILIPGKYAPTKSSRWDTSATLPNRSGRYQGTTSTTWLNFYTPCKSQLKNAWPVYLTTMCYIGSSHRPRPGECLWRSYLKRRGPQRLVEASFCESCVYICLYLNGMYRKDTLYSLLCVYYIYLTLLSSHLHSDGIRAVVIPVCTMSADANIRGTIIMSICLYIFIV